jgi:aryl-alcohol dehydrogenase-like predicted oxidoreductase
MEQRPLGTVGFGLSVVGLGGAWLGHDVSNEGAVTNARRTLRASQDAGVNWVDTSENYFDTGNESVIGAALDGSDGMLICSKVAPGALKSGGGSGFRPKEVRHACEKSLQRLRRPHLDVYLLHWPDDTGVPLAETWGAMAALVEDGLVRSIGLSNYERDEIEACHSQRPVDVLQTGLSLIDYLDDRDLISWCGDQGIAVTIYEPLGSGILTDRPLQQVREAWIGTAWEDSAFFRRLLAPEREDRTERFLGGVREVARQEGATIAQIAIAWVLRQPGVVSAIAGSSNADRARSNAAAGDLVLTDDALESLEELIPLGPTFG